MPAQRGDSIPSSKISVSSLLNDVLKLLSQLLSFTVFVLIYHSNHVFVCQKSF